MNLYWLACAWLAYALLHSALASFAVKEWVAHLWPGFMPWYRLAYNIFAALAALPLVWMVHATAGAWLWRWTGPAAWLANGLALAALVGIAAAARTYDMNDFLGLRQVRGRSEKDAFVISPFHRHVRHPWYFLALVLIWTRDMNGPLLVSASAITLYFVFGSRLEEKKLIAVHGDAYRRYMARVPGLLPLPWKYLTAAEARQITAD